MDRKEYQRQYYLQHKLQKKIKNCNAEEQKPIVIKQSPYNEDYTPVKYDIRKVIHYFEEYAEKEGKTVKQIAIKYGYISEINFFKHK